MNGRCWNSEIFWYIQSFSDKYNKKIFHMKLSSNLDLRWLNFQKAKLKLRSWVKMFLSMMEFNFALVLWMIPTLKLKNLKNITPILLNEKARLWSINKQYVTTTMFPLYPIGFYNIVKRYITLRVSISFQ